MSDPVIGFCIAWFCFFWMLATLIEPSDKRR
jgi:hypothetical protein